MNAPSLLLAGMALMAGLLPTPRASDEAHGDTAGLPPVHGLDARAPIGVPLEIDAENWLRAPGEDWFAARAEQEPGRFTYVEELLDAGGEMVGGWKDAQGEFALRYDEDEEEVAYWQRVGADRLTRGRRDFVQFCASCHGFEGDGAGRSGMALRPPPRNFQQPMFKFSKVPGDFLPSDDALVRLVQRGLNGTPMLPWALSDEQLRDILQYVKSLSPEGQGWRDVYIEIQDVVESGDDPWAGKEAEGIARGEEVYHGVARCHSCHPGYVTPARLAEISGTAGEGRPDLSYPVAKATDKYTVGGHPMLLLPPDFTWHEVRSGTELRDLFETIGSGIGGTAMPKWKDSVPDADIWAMAHYVRHLIDQYKGKTEARAAFMAGLRK